MAQHNLVVERPVNTPGQVLFASMIGTTIEFFDFYIYGTAAVLVFPALVLSGHRSGNRDAGVACHFRDCVLRTSRRLRVVRSLRRSRRAQDDARCGPPDDGTVDGGHRTAANLRFDWTGGACAPRTVPLRAGPGSRWRVGRSGATGDRKRPARPARMVRHVSAARCAGWILHVHHHLSRAGRRAATTISSFRSDGVFRFSRARFSCWSASTSV